MDNRKDKIELLNSIFENVNKWLQWGEAKNAAIFAANIAILLATLSVISDFKCIKITPFIIALLVGIILIFLSSIACFISLYPQLDKVRPCKDEGNVKQNRNSHSNVIFFADCSKFESGQNYLEAFNKKLEDIDDPNFSIENDYACEIIINSRICNFKYRWFKISSWLFIFAILSIILSLIFKFCRV